MDAGPDRVEGALRLAGEAARRVAVAFGCAWGAALSRHAASFDLQLAYGFERLPGWISAAGVALFGAAGLLSLVALPAAWERADGVRRFGPRRGGWFWAWRLAFAVAAFLVVGQVAFWWAARLVGPGDSMLVAAEGARLDADALGRDVSRVAQRLSELSARLPEQAP